MLVLQLRRASCGSNFHIGRENSSKGRDYPIDLQRMLETNPSRAKVLLKGCPVCLSARTLVSGSCFAGTN